MNQEPRELLTQAFEGFERTAAHLQRSQSDLRAEVERLESQLLDAHKRLEAVLDTVDSGVAVLDARGDILRANRTFEDMGLRNESPFDGSRVARVGTARLRKKTPRGERDLAMTVRPVGDKENTSVLTVQDVTEVRRQEEAGGRRRRLEAMGQMAAELAHDVRNPLGSIRLFAGMLRDDLEDRKDLQEMAGCILEAGSSLEATVSNLLAFASPPHSQAKQIDLVELATSACTLLEPTCSARKVRLEGPSSDSECVAWVDPEAMRRVVLNLLGNALAATEEDDHVKVDVCREADSVVLTVEDSGHGIATEDLPRVFDPFFSRSEGGTGLGLSVVHGIVERHRGTISLDPRPGGGTVARMTIPADRRRETSDA